MIKLNIFADFSFSPDEFAVVFNPQPERNYRGFQFFLRRRNYFTFEQADHARAGNFQSSGDLRIIESGGF